MAVVVGAFAEAEVEVVGAGFEGVGHADVGEGPGAPVGVLHVVGAILQPDADVAVGFAGGSDDGAALRLKGVSMRKRFSLTKDSRHEP